jgi:hypothetical protein
VTGRAARYVERKGPALEAAGPVQKETFDLGGRRFQASAQNQFGPPGMVPWRTRCPVVPLSGPDEARPLFGEWGALIISTD